MTKPLFQASQPTGPLFSGAVDLPPRVEETTANDVAQQATLAINQPERFDEFKEQAFSNGTIEDEAYAIIRDQVAKGYLESTIDFESFDQFTLPEKQEALQYAAERADSRRMSNRQLLTIQLALGNFGHLPSDTAGLVEKEYGATELEQLRTEINERQSNELRSIVDEFVAGQGWSNWGTATADVATQELIPFYNVLSKIGFQKIWMDELEIGDRSHFFLGERRQEIREALLAMAPRDRIDAVKNIINEVKKIQADPALGPLLRQFNILENFEAIMTEDLLRGRSAKNSFDRFFGNFESAAEGLFSVFIVAKFGGKSVKSLFKASDANKLRQAAKHTGNRKVQQMSDERLQGAVARAMGIKESDAVAETLPRSTLSASDREVVPPLVLDQLEASGRVKDEIFNTKNVALGEVLSRESKVGAINQAVEDIGLTDTTVPMPAMSVIEELPDGTGVGIRLVLGKTDTDAYETLDQLLPDLIHLDPEYKNFKILQRDKDGKLVDTKISKEELIRLLDEPVETLDDAELLRRSGVADKDSAEFALLEREQARRAGLDTTSLDEAMKDEYFLEHTQVRNWHPADAKAFAGDTLRHTMVPTALLTPNAKFGSNIVTNFFRNYANEQRSLRLFERIYEPYYKLKNKDKRVVASIYEWTEKFGKEQGRNPSMVEVASEFGELTPKQWSGYVALREGYDAQYTVFNRRLYDEMLGRGLVTARGVDADAPLYHGKLINRDSVKQGEYYDPSSREAIPMSKDQIDDLYSNGGGLLELDISAPVPGTKGNKHYKTVIVDGQDYEIGALSQRPLEYYPGYNYRFYDDPYYIVKHHESVLVDGKVVSSRNATEEAVRTAGSLLEGEQYMERNFTRALRTVRGKEQEVFVSKKNPKVWYELKAAREVDQADNVLKQKQALHREGRLFWDSRSRERLPDVHGNQADIMDFTRALERGTAIAARQNTQEDLMKSVKSALSNQYSDLVTGSGRPIFVANKDIKQVVTELQSQTRNVADRAQQARYKEALEVAKYIRMMEGMDSALVPAMRRGVLNLSQWADRTLNKAFHTKAGKFSGVEKYAQMMDPLRTLRSLAFNAFMVLRPARQAVLQGLQPLFLAGIDPVYVLSGLGFKDALALRRGFIKLTLSNFDDGFSSKTMAKSMGLTQKEYTKLVKEFERSGLVDIVDVHSYAGGTRRFNKTRLTTPEDSLARRGLEKVKRGGIGLLEKSQQLGFDFGERLNRTATYNVAWRRVMKEKKYKSLLEFTKDDWTKVQVDAENLSLAMNSTNKAPYQVGFLSLATQFLSFTHKLTLAMMFQNPALRKGEVLKLWVGMLSLYGADSIGQKDEVRRALRSKGIENEDVLDLISAGALETTLNRVGTLTSDDWESYDFASFKPTLAWGDFTRMFYENMVRNPLLGSIGASGSIIGGFAEGAAFAQKMLQTEDAYTPTEKLTRILDMGAKGLLPQYRDLTLAWHSHEVQKLYRQSGENSNLRSTWLSAVAKGTFGLRTEEEMALFQLNREASDKEAIVRDMIRANRKFIKQNFFLYEKGEYSQEEFMRAAETIAILAAHAPDGRSQEVIEGSMLQYFSDDDPETLPIAIFGKHATENLVSKAFVIDAIMQNNDLSDRERALAIEIAEDAMDERIANQEEMRQNIIEHNKRIN